MSIICGKPALKYILLAVQLFSLEGQIWATGSFIADLCTRNCMYNINNIMYFSVLQCSKT